uniref:C2H2-type domain-containing protein n=1 Tax=Maylandia zebra TaxID=106582 RepID=A0A3P9D839_9CICH
MAPFILSLTRISRPVPLAEKQPHSMMFPPPCFTVGMVFLGCNSVFFVLQTRRVEFIPKSSTLVSSDHMTFSQSSAVSSMCSLANFRRAWTCTGFSSGTRLALQDLIPCRCSVLLMVTFVTLVPALCRSFTRSPRVVLGSLLTVLMIILTPRDEILRGAPDRGRLSVVLYVFHFLMIAPTVDFFTPSCLPIVDSLFPVWYKMNYCKECGRGFTTLSDLKCHELFHSGKKYSCDDCGKDFNRTSDLIRHQLIHSGVKAHYCDLCGKSFTLAANLKTHQLIHSGLKPYSCDLCGKSFTQLGHLKRHQLIHSGLKAHSCDQCGKAFARSSSLRNHLVTHSENNQAYSCDICGKTFCSLVKRNIHLRIHTGQDIKISWSTVSNAAVKSSKIRMTLSQESHDKNISLKILKSADSVLCIALKPD